MRLPFNSKVSYFTLLNVGIIWVWTILPQPDG